MKKSIILISALSVVAMVLVSCASGPMTNAPAATHQTNRQTYELPYGRTYDSE
jgi:hypothetical protein